MSRDITVCSGATEATRRVEGTHWNDTRRSLPWSGNFCSLSGQVVVIDFPPRPNTEVPVGVPANRLGQGVPLEVAVSEVSSASTHVRTIPAWAPDSEPAML